MINFFKKPIFIAATIIVVVISIFVYGFKHLGKTKNPDYYSITAEKRDLIQEVNVSGRVKPAKNINLAFEKSGKVSAIYVKIGEKVKAGQTLIVLESQEILAELNQAEARIESAKAKLTQYEAALEKERAKLSELKRGALPEEVQVQEVKVANQKIALEDAKNNLIDKLQDGYTKSDDAIRNKVDQFFNNPRSERPQLVFSPLDAQLKIDLEWERILMESTLKLWKTESDSLTISGDINASLFASKKNLNQVKLFLDKAALAVNSLIPNLDLTKTTIDGWKSDIATARSNINTATNSITSAEEKLKTAKSNLALIEQELVLKKTGAPEEQITGQEAQIKQVEADIASQKAAIKEAEVNADQYRVQIAKTIIQSPIDGLIVKQEVEVGEIVSANTIILSIISASEFEIEANVPEADIAKIKIGDLAKVTLDAYQNDVIFEAKTVRIDPAETIIDGVATYKTTFQFTKNNGGIKPGMTADIDIFTAKKEGAIVVPSRAVITRDKDKFVKKFFGEEIREIKVLTGLRGSDGNVEILEGINEGDKIIIFNK